MECLPHGTVYLFADGKLSQPIQAYHPRPILIKNLLAPSKITNGECKAPPPLPHFEMGHLNLFNIKLFFSNCGAVLHVALQLLQRGQDLLLVGELTRDLIDEGVGCD